MKNFMKMILLLACFCFSTSLIGYAEDNSVSYYETKLYFDSNNLGISDNIFYIHSESNLVETNVVRIDSQGLYVFQSDITNYDIAKEKKWKCPYCNRWWVIGQKCENEECPTNQW